jgi:hypothetical protein
MLVSIYVWVVTKEDCYYRCSERVFEVEHCIHAFPSVSQTEGFLCPNAVKSAPSYAFPPKVSRIDSNIKDIIMLSPYAVRKDLPVLHFVQQSFLVESRRLH